VFCVLCSVLCDAIDAKRVIQAETSQQARQKGVAVLVVQNELIIQFTAADGAMYSPPIKFSRSKPR
jgi:hypothetical protein